MPSTHRSSSSFGIITHVFAFSHHFFALNTYLFAFPLPPLSSFALIPHSSVFPHPLLLLLLIYLPSHISLHRLFVLISHLLAFPHPPSSSFALITHLFAFHTSPSIILFCASFHTLHVLPCFCPLMMQLQNFISVFFFAISLIYLPFHTSPSILFFAHFSTLFMTLGPRFLPLIRQFLRLHLIPSCLPSGWQPILACPS